MNDTRDVTQDREEYVDQQVGTTPALQEDSKGRDKNSKTSKGTKDGERPYWRPAVILEQENGDMSYARLIRSPGQ